jgi:hypothetical protein
MLDGPRRLRFRASCCGDSHGSGSQPEKQSG